MEAPDPPVIGQVTHNTIELFWDQSREKCVTNNEERIKYCIQEEEGKSKNYFTVYRGYANTCILNGIKENTTHRYRVQIRFTNTSSPWSSTTEVTTKSFPSSGAQLHRAVLNLDVDKVTMIVKNNESMVDVPDRMGCSPLMVASQKGYTSVIDALLSHGADVSFSNSSGKDSMMMACFTGHVNVATTLKSHGASLEAKDHGGSTALHWAVDGGSIAAVEWLLSNGAEVDELDVAEWTPLMRVATLDGTTEVAKMLLQSGANVNTEDKQGRSALMAAALSGRLDLVKLFVEHGADTEKRNSHGHNALDFAQSFGRNDVVSYLKSINRPQNDTGTKAKTNNS
ncbi:fibronectin type 3 and ankyrin repeat domains 1 protein-like [Xenia sp. Carnegie-2017]|uniref:fibronectin type 3 and ankyrin repeat domains 1 protein-like n=1 Tax=Xenia sp. Carnegie-2017 TaxID=2897299 RepID=UPI001F042DC3|nr:fibronectin type 3 and ankyrin repeat domains 1 protein-like [Xenia sp. Carnegie-2017]